MMAAAIALQSRDLLGESANHARSAEEKALDFFRRAELTDALDKNAGRNNLAISASHARGSEEKALDFFRRAELSDALKSAWEIIKRQRLGTVLKLTKAVAIVAGAVLLSQSISIGGMLALVGAIGGLLFAAITNVYTWLIYIPLYFVNPSDFASSALLAIGLAWLVGISPFFALVISPLILFGFRLVGRPELAQAPVSETFSAIGKAVEQVNLGAAFQQAAGNVARLVGKTFALGTAKALL